MVGAGGHAKVIFDITKIIGMKVFILLIQKVKLIRNSLLLKTHKVR